MSRPYRPCDLAEALLCEHCGTDANEPGSEAALHRMDERLTWQCNRCDQQTWSSPLPAEYGQFVQQLDQQTMRGDLAGWLRRHDPRSWHGDTAHGPAAPSSAAPADLNADRTSSVRLRPHNGVSSVDVLRRLIRWEGRVKVDFGPDDLTLSGPADLVLAARRDLTTHRLVHRAALETR